jgi:RNA polymerase sigma-70 factor (ECF subfamily)
MSPGSLENQEEDAPDAGAAWWTGPGGTYSSMTLARRAARGLLRLVPGERPSPPSGRVEDEALIDAIERGDQHLGGEIYERLIRVVDSTLYRIVGPGDRDHDDLVQTAFEQIVTTIAKKKYARACSLTSWAAAVTCNIALNALRSRVSERRVFDARMSVDDEADRIRGGGDVERQVAARERLEKIRRHLAVMNSDRAETLLLHDFFGKELSEIAVLTGASVAAAQSRLVRARHELFEKLEEDGLLGEES